MASWGCGNCIRIFEIVNFIFILAWAVAIPAVIEATSLWEQIQDVPELLEPPYHPDLARGQQTAAAITIFTVIWGGVLLFGPIMVGRSAKSVAVWASIRIGGQLVMIACYIPAIVYQGGYVPVNGERGCWGRHSWPPGSGVSSDIPTMFDLIPDVKRKSSRWNSCERFVALYYEEITIVAILAASICLTIPVATHKFITRRNTEQPAAMESHPLRSTESRPLRFTESRDSQAYDSEYRPSYTTMDPNIVVR